MKHRLPWYLNPWRHVLLLARQRNEARRQAERSRELMAERDAAQEASSKLLAEFGAMRLELERYQRISARNRANRRAKDASHHEHVMSTAAAMRAEAPPRKIANGNR